MAEDKKSKFLRIGAVVKKRNGKGVVVALGNAQAKNEKYRTTVEVTLKDASGKTIAKTTNGFLSVFNPRQRPGITDAEIEKIPDALVSELFLVQDNE
jgi:hypothetical protein